MTAAACSACGERLTVRKKYRIRERLGEGSYGEVFSAVDVALNRKVALKLLFGDAAKSPKRRARFLSECRAMAALDHPAIARIHEADSAHGRLYLVQELVDGTPLVKLLSEVAAWERDTLVAFFRELLGALAHAHDGGVTHRDLNPNNVMVVDGQRPKIIDFGMARFDEQEATRGAWGGTPGYTAPEQMLDPDSNAARADLFAVGAILHRVLLGAPPHHDLLTAATGDGGKRLVEAYRQIAERDGPSEEGWDTIEPVLAAVLRRSLASAPAARFADANAMSVALDGAPEPATATIDLPAEPSAPTTDAAAPAAAEAPKGTTSSRGAAILAGLVVVGAGAGWLALREPTSPESAQPTATASVSDSTPSASPAPQAAPVDELPWLFPAGATRDDEGVVYVADQGGHRVQRFHNGQVDTLAGSGVSDFADGAADKASFDTPCDVAWSAHYGVVVADRDNHRLRAVKNGKVTTLAGGFTAGAQDGSVAEATLTAPTAVAADDTVVAFVDDRRVRQLKDDTVVTLATGASEPTALAFDDAGALLVWDAGRSALLRANGERFVRIATLDDIDEARARVAGQERYHFAPHLAARGDSVWLSDVARGKLFHKKGDALVWLAGDGRRRSVDGAYDRASFDGPAGIVAEESGKLLVLESGAGSLRVLAEGRVNTAVVGGGGGLEDGPAAEARFFMPYGLAVAGGAIVVADVRNARVRTIADGRVASLAHDGLVPWGVGSGPEGALIVDGAAGRLFSLDGDKLTPVAAVGATWRSPEAVTSIDSALFVADTRGHRIWRVHNGRATVFAGTGKPGHQDGELKRAMLSEPAALVALPDGTLLVAEAGSHAVRKIEGDRVITLAGRGVAGFVDGEATDALFEAPSGITAAPNGAIYIADGGNHRIRKLENGAVTTVAGVGVPGFRDGPAKDAALAYPADVAWHEGALYIADAGNNLIRMLKDDQVSTVAGAPKSR